MGAVVSGAGRAARRASPRWVQRGPQRRPGSRADGATRPRPPHPPPRGGRCRSERRRALDHPHQGGVLDGRARMIWPAPTPEEQVQFLRNVQRLLAEGQFTASYKFALVHALADLAVLKGEDNGAPLEIETKEIAAKFVELYWRQARPLQNGGEMAGLILQYNTGGQAEAIPQM